VPEWDVKKVSDLKKVLEANIVPENVELRHQLLLNFSSNAPARLRNRRTYVKSIR
jgi:hypothetical protein